MSIGTLATAHEHLGAALDELCAVTENGSGQELLSLLTVFEGATRRLDRLTVAAVSRLEREGTFTERGYRSPVGALADLLGWERFEARRRVTAAEQVCPRIGLDGEVLPPRLPATATVFAAGETGLRHVEVIARVLATGAAARLTSKVWEGAEVALADKASQYTPAELHAWGTALIEALDVDGPEPDDRPPAPVNELHLSRHRGKPGGKIVARFDDAAMFDAIATVIDAHAKPLSSDDDRPTVRRQAEALADVCGYVLDHGDVPECGGRRPHLNVIIPLEELERRARAAVLDLGGTLSPQSLRMLACDAGVVPIVMDGAGQPLDVGRSTRTIPDGLRRAVAARDRGWAHPGCDRPVSWCEIHHVQPWEQLGKTQIGNCVMLCRVHHRLIHHSDWIVRITDGLPEFIPPAWIDPERRARRKALPHLVDVLY